MFDRNDENDGGEAPASPLAAGTSAAIRTGSFVLEVLGGLALAALTLLTVADALLRSFANRPILGADDLIQVMLVLVVAASLPLCVVAGRAIAIDFVTALLPDAIRPGLFRLVSAVCAIALAILSWRCAINAREAARFGETTMLLQIPFGPLYWCLAVSFVFCAVLFARDLVRGPASR